MNNLKPKFVYVNWSESPAFEDSSIYSFEQFERISETVAENHDKGGSYKKTNITVIFKCGNTYQARVDLNPSCLNFEQHISQCKLTYKKCVDGNFERNDLWVQSVVDLNETWKRIQFKEVA